MHYYGTRLSENISRREPEGYLLCLNVPVARTGVQEYLPEELGISGGSMVEVYRPEEEVFSPETVASFEGMPVTNDHPPEGVDVSNIRALQKGHAHNVRRGSGDESDLLLADLIITDPHLIDLILDGKREISCGYTYELCEENGTYIQRKIRGNHVAVVDAGRAGKRVEIRDHKGCDLSATTQAPLEPAPRVSIKDHKASISERRKPNMKKSLSKILARMAKDGDIETVAEIIEEMIEPEAPAEAVAEVTIEEAEEVVVDEGEEPATASGGNLAGSEVNRNEQAPQCGAATIEVAESLADVISRLDQIISLLTPAARDEDPVEEIVEAVEEAVGEALETAGGGNLASAEVNRNEQAPQWGAATIVVAGAAETAAEEVAAIVEEILEPEGEELAEVISDLNRARTAGVIPASRTAHEIDGEENEPEVISTGDALRAALKSMRPVLAKMPKKQRSRVCADIAARLNGKKIARKGIYGAMNDAARRRPDADPDLGKRIMASRNPNYKH